MLNTLASPVIFTEASRPVPLYSGASGGVWYSLLKEWDGRGGGVSLPLRLMSSSLVMSLLVSSEKIPDSNLTRLHSWPVFSHIATLSPALSAISSSILLSAPCSGICLLLILKDLVGTWLRLSLLGPHNKSSQQATS